MRRLLLTSLAMISFVIGGSVGVAIGFLINPLMIEFKWTSGLASSTATAFNLAALLMAPAVGIALDKFGARPVMALGALVASLGLFLAGSSSNWCSIAGAFVLAGSGYCASFYVPSAVVAAKCAGSNRNFAMGIVLGAMSLGAATFSSVFGWCIESYGWRATIKAIAVLVATMVPLIWLTMKFRSAPDSQRHESSPDSDRLHQYSSNSLISTAFLMLVASGTLFSVGMFGIYYHFISVLVAAGYSVHFAGVVMGVSWLLSALGSFGLGMAADRVGAKFVLSGALCACACGTLFLLGADASKFGMACVATFVLLWGTSSNCVSQFLPVILSELFGAKNIGILVGVETAIAGVAGAISPVGTGLLYDRFGSYSLAISLSVLATSAALILVSLISVPKRGADPSAIGQSAG